MDFSELLDKAEDERGPWIYARYGGNCDTCGEEFEEGDRIRADGAGGWQGKECCGSEEGH